MCVLSIILLTLYCYFVFRFSSLLSERHRYIQVSTYLAPHFWFLIVPASQFTNVLIFIWSYTQKQDIMSANASKDVKDRWEYVNTQVLHNIISSLISITTSAIRFSKNCRSDANMLAIRADIKQFGVNLINALDSVCSYLRNILLWNILEG